MDVVSECLQDMNADESIGVGEQALARYSQRILKRLAGKYRSQLKMEDTIWKQRDLLEVIEEVPKEEQAKQTHR